MSNNPRVGHEKECALIVRFTRTVPTGFIKASLVALLAAMAVTARALPSFARQMNLQCAACHAEFPILTDMGRLFKLSGYTMSSDQSMLPVIAAMIEPSFTNTRIGQDGGAAPGFAANNNYATTQASLFYAGRLFGPYASKLFGNSAASFLNKIGIFSQMTYDGVAKTWSWDNTELRYADNAAVSGHNVLWGVYLNNNPTLQDPWNTVPAWGFPFASSKLAPTPGAAPLIAGALAQQVAGVGAYAMIDNKLYLDLGAYKTLPSRVQHALGIDPSGETQIASPAPYCRIAYTQSAGGGAWETGLFALAASAYPGRDNSAGTDRMVDFGIDTEFQKTIGANDLTTLVTYIHESDKWNASQALGNTAKSSGTLDEFKGSVHYLIDKTYGFAVQYFSVTGSSDSLAYASSPENSPNSDGYILEADYLPLNKGTGPAFWPRSNVKFSLQYTAYNRFDGSKTNVDGGGHSAKDNNTLYLQAWFAF
ncbi:cytochrome C [Opitutus sp. GAS368]|uniref:cytochrome C n=1 Tax=Opitutus sp. GAS368 TaxID=1882749 RepID=UPI00087D73B2|nr:cytochrome C [Opitutus sp. GAS368]SDS44956.1 hypothetical protein SAMN05444173_2921 [Opitutus sp. GAS368]